MSSLKKKGFFKLYWKVENFSLLLAGRCSLRSPCFDLDTSNGTSWRYLYVIHDQSRNIDTISFRVACLTGSSGIDRIDMFYISSGVKVPMKKTTRGEFYIERNSIADDNGISVLPNDTLTICCKVWKQTTEKREYHKHSVLHRFNYNWKLDDYTTFHCQYIVENSVPFFLQLKIKDTGSAHTFLLKGVNGVDEWVSFLHCKLSLDHEPKPNSPYTVPSNIYDSIVQHMGECCESDIIIDTENNRNFQLCVESIVALHKVSPEDQLSLSQDLLHLYQVKFLCDATINAGGQSFSVHKNILSARSPVFRSMFEEMTEGPSDVVDIYIDDIDAETFNRLLVFMYSGSLEDLQWDQAMTLYYASDKYDVQPLKAKCRDILTSGLSASNVFDTLQFADRRSDQELVKIAVNFLRKNKEVMSSPECLQLEESNPRLAAKILREVYVEKGGK